MGSFLLEVDVLQCYTMHIEFLYVIGFRKELAMENTTLYTKEEIQKAREELFCELDKGIRDMEQGNVISCDEAIHNIRRKYGLFDV